MSDLRLILAEEIAEQIGAELFTGRCSRCAFPLLEFRDQRLPFCWECAASSLVVMRARDLLERLKRGITITHRGNECFIQEKGQAA